MLKSYRILLTLAGLACLPVPAAAQMVDTLALRGHTRFLADDLLLGRGTGTEGERLAAAYIASQAARIGLTPVGDGSSYLHPLPLRRAVMDPSSRVVVHAHGDSMVFHQGADFIMNTGGRDAFRDFRGRGVFFGQPVHAAEPVAGHGSMVGRVAVFLGPLGASAVEIIPALSHAGAAGVVLLVPDATQYDLYVRSRGAARYFVDGEVSDPVWQPPLPVLIAGPALSEFLLEGTDIPASLIQGGADAGVDLDRAIVARVAAHMQPVPSANVAALLPGADPAAADRYVVYTAHYDHLGISSPDPAGDSIYNGFSDNAAGVAMLLGIAEALSGEPPPHSTIFLFFSGEERGLLGSSWMAARPPFDPARVMALINLDAGAPPAPPVAWRIAGGNSPLGDVARRVAEARGWRTLMSDAAPNSDHWPFLHRGVPSIFIIPGDEWENTSTAERDALRRRWDRYHQAGDHWHADFPFAGLGRYADFALLVGLEAAGLHQ
ncbi:MAG TPA: M28 family peptidase [Longimicrobiales bacterium]|nr:M28 family peptidase [Longimicrobiales bacterium]